MIVKTFNLPFKAMGKESIRRGASSFYTSDRTESYMQQCASIFRRSSLEAPARGPVAVEISCYFRRPKTVAVDEKFMCRKPDVDNIEKAIYDAATGILWVDDCQVALSLTKKYWSNNDSVEVKVTIF
jgi:Holliday junction resolvase RusA-like endonuclease